MIIKQDYKKKIFSHWRLEPVYFRYFMSALVFIYLVKTLTLLLKLKGGYSVKNVLPPFWIGANSKRKEYTPHSFHLEYDPFKRDMVFRRANRKLNKLSPIMKTYLYNFDPLKPRFYIAKLGFAGV